MPQFTQDQLRVFCDEEADQETILRLCMTLENLDERAVALADELYKFCTYTAEQRVGLPVRDTQEQADRVLYTSAEYFLSVLKNAAAVMGGNFPYGAINDRLRKMQMKVLAPENPQTAPVCGLH